MKTLQDELQETMFKYEYKSIDTSTIEGIKEAEKLHESGWKIVQVGLFTILFEKERIK